MLIYFELTRARADDMDENGSKLEKKIIAEYYGGDVAAYHKHMRAKVSHAYRWNDIHAHAVVLPQYELEALLQIEAQIGYRPSRRFTLPHEPFIRQALYDYDFVHRDFDKLWNDCQVHIDKIVVDEARI